MNTWRHRHTLAAKRWRMMAVIGITLLVGGLGASIPCLGLAIQSPDQAQALVAPPAPEVGGGPSQVTPLSANASPDPAPPSWPVGNLIEQPELARMRPFDQTGAQFDASTMPRPSGPPNSSGASSQRDLPLMRDKSQDAFHEKELRVAASARLQASVDSRGYRPLPASPPAYSSVRQPEPVTRPQVGSAQPQYGRTLLRTPQGTTAPQSDATILGRVTYTNSTPAAYVNVDVWCSNCSGTNTDANGYYTVTVPPGNASLASRVDGYTCQSSPSINATSGQVYTNINLTLLINTAWVTGTVRDQYGVAVPDPNVSAADRANGHHLNSGNWSDPSGHYVRDVAAGTWALDAWKDGYVRTDPTWEFVVSEGMTLTRDITLTRLDATIRGTVRDASSNPVAGVNVNTGVPGWGTDTQTDASGNYTLTVYGGGWQVNVNKQGYLSNGGQYVNVSDGGNASLDFTLAQATAQVVGTVHLGESGPAVPDAWVWTWSQGSGPGWTGGTNADASGVFTLGVKAGDWILISYPEGYTLKETPFFSIGDGGTVTGASLTIFTNTATITGTTQDQYGNPVNGVQIVPRDPNYGHPLNKGTNSDSGTYALSIAAGTWQLDTENMDGYRRPERQTVTVGVGATRTDVNFTLYLLDSTIQGTVRDTNNHPIPGAHVGTGVSNWGTDAWTDASGNYTLTVNGGAWNVSCDASGYLSAPGQDVTVPDGGTASGVDFTLTPASAWIVGTVWRNTTGGPVAVPNQWVWANRYQSKGNSGANTDASGVFTIGVTAGDWFVVTRYDGYTLQQTPLISVLDGHTQSGTNLLLLPHNAAVTGRVMDQNSAPIPNAWVEIRDAVTRHWLQNGTNTDASGFYTMPVAAGTWKINASRDGYLSPPDQQFTVLAGMTQTKDIYLNGLYSRIVGTVRERGSGAPIPGASVWAWNPKQEAGGDNPPDQVTDASGVYTMSVYAGEWHLNARKIGWTRPGDIQRTVADGQEPTGADIELTRADAEIRGTVVISGGNPVPYAYVETWKQQNKDNPWEWNAADANASGFYTMPVSAGDWVIFSNLSGYTTQHTPFVSIGSGEVVTENIVLLPNTAILSGTVRDQYGFPVPYAHIEVFDAQTSGRVIPWDAGFVDSMGKYYIGIAGGTWSVNVSRDSYAFCGNQTFTVADGQTRDLDLRMTHMDSTIQGTVRDDYGNAITTPVTIEAGWSWGCYGTQTTSDINGNYAISATKGGWDIRASTDLPGFIHAQKQQQSVLVDNGQTLDGVDVIYRTRDNIVTGTVRDGSGAPLAGAEVDANFRVVNGEWWGTSTNADASGIYTLSLSSGTWQISAPPRSGSAAPPALALALAHNEKVGNINLSYLAGTATIRGTVRAGGVPAADVAVAAMYYNGTTAANANTDASGVYTLTVAAGVWQVQPQSDLKDQTVPPPRGVSIGDGATVTNVDFTYLANTAIVRGQIRRPDGTPASNFGIGANTNLSWGPWSPNTRADSNGFYTLTVPAGHWQLNAWDAYGFVTQPPNPGVWLSGGQTVNLDFVYASNDSFITGRVTGSDGSPKVGVYVNANKSGMNESVWGISTNAGGYYTLSVSAGSWDVRVSSELPGYTAPPNQIVQVMSGQTVAGVDLVYAQNNGSVSGRVTRGGVGVGGVYLGVWSPIYGWFSNITTGNDGNYVLHLPYGDWWMWTNAPSRDYVSAGAKHILVNGNVTGVDYEYLPANRTITGIVRVGGSPRAGVWVNADSPNGSPPGISTDANGVYTLSVSADIWTVHVDSDLNGYVRPAQQRVDVLDGSVSNVDFAYLTANAIVTGRFQDDAGHPLVGARAQAWWDMGMASPNVPQVWSNPSGVYTLPLSAGNWWMGKQTSVNGLSTPPGWGVSLSSGKTITGVDQAYVVNTNLVTGTVKDAAGNPVYGVWVDAYELHTDRSAASVTTDRQGRFALSVSEGLWQVGTSTPILGNTTPDYRSVQVATGETVANINLQYAANTTAIAGTIRNGSGAPLAGIPLRAYNQAGVNAPNLTTDASGHYALGVSPGFWTVQPDTAQSGYTTPGSRAVTATSGITATLDFTYTAATGRIQGTVKDDFGNPLRGLWLDAALDEAASSGGGSPWSPVASTDGNGRYSARLSPGLGWVSTGDRPPGYLDPQGVDVYVTSGGSITVNLVYSAATYSIAGRVTVGGLPVQGAQVSAKRIQSGWSPAVPSVYTDRDGKYTLQVAPGTYAVMASAPAYISSASQLVTVTTASRAGVDLTLDRPNGWLSGIVRDSAGRPLQGANVWLFDGDSSWIAQNLNGSTMASARTNNAGAFVLPMGVGSGSYHLLASKEGYRYASISINYAMGWNPVINLTLSPEAWGTVSGRVTSSAGGPVATFLVWLRESDGLRSGLRQNNINAGWYTINDDTDGRYFLSPLPPGSYSLRVIARGYETRDVAVTVPAKGEVTANLVMTPTTPPAYGVGYVFVNAPITMSVGSSYYALLRQHNLGTTTWASGGVNLGYRWTNASGTVVLTETAAANLSFDVTPDMSVYHYAVVRPPAFSGVYTLTWDLIQGSAWFGNLGAATQSMVVRVLGAPPPVDLAVADSDLWVDPSTFRQGEPPTVTLGLNVHNLSDQLVRDVEVCFRDGSSSGPVIGSCPMTITLIPPHGVEAATTTWATAALAGSRIVYGVMDPDHHISETLETNNVATRTVVILPPASDITAPVGSLLINGGADTTAVPAVTLALTATDTGGSGLRWMNVVEFAFDLGAKQWKLTDHKSGWVNFATTYPWTLSSGGGAKLLRVWFADGASNISEPAQATINLIVPCDGVGTGQWKLYGREISAGTLVAVTLNNCNDPDPDLYVWSPGSQGEPDYYSTFAGIAPDAVNFVAPTTGFYRFYVYGYEAANFTLYMTSTLGASGMSRSLAGTRVLASDKTLPSAPPAAVEEPPVYTPTEMPIYKIYLPVVFRNR